MMKTAAICLLFITVCCQNGYGQNVNPSLWDQLPKWFPSIPSRRTTTPVTNRTSEEVRVGPIRTTTEDDEFVDDGDESTTLRSQTTASTSVTVTTSTAGVDEILDEMQSTTLLASTSSETTIVEEVTTGVEVAITSANTTITEASTTQQDTSVTELPAEENTTVPEVVTTEASSTTTVESTETTTANQSTAGSTTVSQSTIESTTANQSTPENTTVSWNSSEPSTASVTETVSTVSTAETYSVTVSAGNLTVTASVNESSTLTSESMTTGLPIANISIQEPGSLIQNPSTAYWESQYSSKDCEKLGFSGSLLNRCGFCVGGSTNLKDDYGLGVDGSCREAHLDCSGHLGGNSFPDPCTGQCINVPITYDGGNIFDKGGRDCRGICQSEGTKRAIPIDAFVKDECSVCVANPLPTVSIYKDCSGKCYTPGTKGLMAVQNGSTCGKCVALDELNSSNVTDACGNCADLNKTCTCPGSQIDACGVCGGDNTTCLAAFSVFPPAVPSFTSTKVWVKGGALKNKHHTFCMLVRDDVPADGLDEAVFPAEIDGDGVHCEINATSGKYHFHLSIVSETLNVISNISSLFTIYPVEANGTSIEPLSAEIDSGNTTLNITVKGQYLNSTGLVYCNLTDPVSGNSTIFISNTTAETSENVTCQILLPDHSYAALFEVSLDGVRTIAGPFNFTFKTPAPKIEHIIHFSDVSLAAVIFDRPVNISKVSNCAALLTHESLALLDEDDNCTWASPFQLVIGLPRHIDGQSIVLKFMDGALTSSSGQFAVPAIGMNVTIPAVNTDPIAVLQGPRVVPTCASFFLYGHQSDTNGGGDLVSYNWTVQPSSNNSLNDLLIEATKAQKPYVEINSTLLNSTEYTFFLNVTTSNGHSSIANWTVRRLESPVAILVLESSVDPAQGPVANDQTITLIARADVPGCVNFSGNLNFMWTMNNPKVRFDFEQMSSRIYVIKPFSLPSGENVTFQVRVWIGEDVANSVNSSITFATKPEMLVAKIKGGSKLVIGTESGGVLVDAKDSGRSGRRTSRLVYQWTCLEKTGNPCYVYANSSATSTILIEQPYTVTPQLVFPSNLLLPDSVLKLNLVVIDEERHRSAPRNLTIEVLQGFVPQVVIDSVRANGLESSLQDESQSIYVIPSESTVVLSGTVIHNTEGLPSIDWIFEPGLLIEPMIETVRKTDTISMAIITILPGSLITGASYQVQLISAYEDKPAGMSEITLMILPPVTGCLLTIPPYTALSQVTADVRSCAALKGLRPLAFRLSVKQNVYSTTATLIPLTSPQFHLPLTFLGPPALTNSTVNIFTLEVCHALRDCANFSSGPVVVMQPTPTDVALFGKTVMESANRTAALGMYLDALSQHAIYFLALGHDNSSESAIAGEHVPAAVQAAEQLNQSPCKDPVCFSDMFSYISLIPINNNDTAVHVLNVLHNATLELNASGLQLPFSGGQRAIWTLEKILKNVNTSDANLTTSVVDTEDLLEQILARNLHFGEREEMVDENGDRVAILEYSFLDHDLTTSTHNRTLVVHFEDGIRNNYKLWDCTGKSGNNESCMGVVAQVHMYPNFVPYKLEPNRTISDVVAISLLNPLTGSHMKVTEADPDDNPLTTVSLQLRSPPTDDNFSPICHVWDESSGKWTVDGVTTVEHKGNVDCHTGKLSPIVVLWIDPGLSGGAIAAIVIACVVFVVGVTVAAILVHRRLTTKTLRVTPPNGIPMSYSEPRYH